MSERSIYQELKKRVRDLERDARARIRSEEELRDAEEKYNIHFTLANDVMFSYDARFRVDSVTPNVQRLLGYSPEELIGKTFLELNVLDPADMDIAVADATKVLAGQTIYASVYRFITKDGEQRYGEVSGVPFRRKGSIVGVISVARDITQRIEMEQSYREDMEKYHTHFSLANDVMYTVNPHHVITSVSPGVEHTLGYRPEELVGRPFQELNVVHPDDMIDAVEDTLKVLAGEKVDSSIYRFITKDGEIRFGEVTGVPFLKDGKVKSIITVARDITERIEMEKSLRESEERFRTIFESAQDCIFIKNVNLEYVFVNPCMQKLVGLPLAGIIGRREEDLLADCSDPEGEEVDRRVIAGEVVEGEYSRMVNNEIMTFHIIKVPMRDSAGRITGLCGIARDITERKRFEEQLLAKERELAHQAKFLEEMNITLKVLLDSREKEKKQAQEIIVSKARKIIYPYLEKLEAGNVDEEMRIYLSVIKANLDELVTPYINPLSQRYLDFTPMEMRIADLIRQGKSTKEIAALLRVSPFAVSFHRSNIRKKCGLLNSKKNLRAYLNTMEQES